MSFESGLNWNLERESADLSDRGADWEEAWDYQPGFTVELRAEPGVLHVVESYDPMMVPPIWLSDDPRPRYPHELKVISHQSQYVCPLAVPLSPAKMQRSQVVA